MAGSAPNGRWGRVLRYTFAAFLCLLAIVDSRVGFPWYGTVVILCTAVGFVLGRRRIFHPGINHAAGEIVCRYVPWYEGNAYFLCLLLPLMGIATLMAGRDPEYPTGLQVGGIVLLVLTPLFVHSLERLWRRCLLCISPSALTVRLVARGAELTEIRREHVESITPMIVTNGVGGQSLQVEISYHCPDSSSNQTETVLLGLHLTVQPINLLNALVAWKDATNEDPDELLDRIEQILRGRLTVGV